MDGTHIDAVIGDDKGIQYRGRKGNKTWNVLACCSFDMLFTYVHIGWEGSVHDQTVWADSITQPKYCFPHPPPVYSSFPSPPSIAYFISGSTGDIDRIERLLYAVYHPNNFYLLHLDRFDLQSERDEVALRVQMMSIFEGAKNVFVVGKADFAYHKGSTFISTTLCGASILLRLGKK